MSDGGAGHVTLAERAADAPSSKTSDRSAPQWLSLLSGVYALQWRWLRQVLADGYAIYWLACALTAAALFFVHLSVEPTSTEHDTLLSLLNDRREPYRGEQYPTLAALVVPGRASDPHCSNATALERLAKEFQYSYEAPPGPLPALVLRRSSGHRSKAPVLSYWTIAPAPSSNPTASSSGPAGSGSAAEPDVDPDVPADDLPSFDDPAATSTVRIPHTLLASNVGSHAEQLITKIVRASAVDRLWLDREKWFGKDDRLISIYFVSVDGALRYAPHWPSNGVPGYHLFNSASYVYATLQAWEARQFPCGDPDLGWIETKPYLDIVGAGQTVTLCSPVVRARRYIEGVLCVDFTAGDKNTPVDVDHLKTLFDVTYARVRRGAQNAPQTKMCGEPGFESCGAPDLALDDSARRALRDKIKSYADRYPEDWDTRDHDQILVLDPDNGDYALWLPSTASQGTPSAGDAPTLLLMHLRQRSHRGFLYTFVAILVLVGVGGLVVYRVRERQRRENVQIMFDLPTGVLHENPEGFIVDANDRAEEVLNEKLPRSGFDPSRAEALTFESLFGRFVSEGFTELDYRRDIVPLRDRGVTSTYYALTHRDRWVQVTGSALLRADGRTEHFGVIEPASRAVDAVLRERCAAGRPS